MQIQYWCENCFLSINLMSRILPLVKISYQQHDMYACRFYDGMMTSKRGQIHYATSSWTSASDPLHANDTVSSRNMPWLWNAKPWRVYLLLKGERLKRQSQMRTSLHRELEKSKTTLLRYQSGAKKPFTMHCHGHALREMPLTLSWSSCIEGDPWRSELCPSGNAT